MSNKYNIIISHPTGNSNVRSAVGGLLRSGLLFNYVTSIAIFSTGFWHYLSKINCLKTLTRRIYSDNIKDFTICHPWKELGRQLSLKFGWKYFLKHECGFFCVDKEYEVIDKYTTELLADNKDKIDAVYCYDDGALYTFKMAKELGKVCLFDLPIAHWRTSLRVAEEEKNKKPEWAATISSLYDSAEKLKRKDEELRLADRIYVASSFTKRTLEDYQWPLKDIVVIPYGFPKANMDRKYDFSNCRKIKALYVGRLTQMKGLSYVFESVEGLEEHIELTVVGHGNVNGCLPLKEALKKVNYIPTLPHDKVLKLMSESDVLIFPSLLEGFGLVITEAMSQGTPVITTDRTCGAEFIINGQNGWIVETGTAAPIKTLLHQFINSPELLRLAGIAARETARLRPWRCYEDELASSIESFLNGKLS